MDGGFILCVLAILVLIVVALKVPKRTVRHRSLRQTHIKRTTLERCVWLQRLTDSLFKTFTTQHAEEWRKNIATRLAAALEDNGHARNVDVKVHDLGDHPPTILAVSAQETGASGASVVVEAEIEYNGGLEAELSADVPAVRARTLPVSVAFKELYVRFHCQMRFSVIDAESTSATPKMDVRFSLLSQPEYSLDLRTQIGRHPVLCIKDNALLAYFVKRITNKVLASKVMHPAQFRKVVPLPASMVPGQSAPWQSADLLSDATSNMGKSSFA